MDRICIDGFPRSGNIFCQQALTKAFPNTYIIPFTHSASVLTDEHFVLIREPHKSISSFMSVFQELNQEASERWWLRFYNTALDKTDPTRWIFFDDLVNKTAETINRVGKIVKIEPIKIDYSSLPRNSSLETYPIQSFNKAQELYLKLKQKDGK